MATPEHDVPVDLPSIIAIRKHMYWRWLPFYSLQLLKFVPLAALCGAGLHWLLRWWQPEGRVASPLVMTVTFGAAAFMLCLWTLPAMLRLDFRISQRLTHMARRIAAGETVYASEVRDAPEADPPAGG